MPDDLQLLVSPESLERKHEVGEKSLRNVFIVGAAAVFLLVIGLAVCGGMIHLLSQARPMQWMKPLGIIIAPSLKPLEQFPKPNLQIDDDHDERIVLYQAQMAELNSYGWVDRGRGIVHIPMDRAMNLLLQRGLPTRTNGVYRTDGSPLQLIQQISKSQ